TDHQRRNFALEPGSDLSGGACPDDASRRNANGQIWTLSARLLCSLAVFCLVALFGQAWYPDGCVPVAHTACYCKHTATFRDVLALVRRHLWGQGTFPTSPTDPGVVLVPHATLERWSLAVC
ncbi:MAG TPA: hypothetical protein VIY29_07290, partial [Ktedonobacteraceae bacterium]